MGMAVLVIPMFLLHQFLERIAGTCLTFFPTVLRSKAKTISGVRSKKPTPLFQLMPHLQCSSPINCCFIFLPQFGHTLPLEAMRTLLFEIETQSRRNLFRGLSGFLRLLQEGLHLLLFRHTGFPGRLGREDGFFLIL